MIYFVKCLFVANETQVKVFCISVALSQRFRITYMAFEVPLSFIKPYCSSPISLSSFVLLLASIIFKMILVMWLIKLNVLCCPHSTVPGFLGIAMKIDFDICSGITPVSYILLANRP